MFAFLCRSHRVLVLRDADAFWSHCDRTQDMRNTPRGLESEAEERLDLRAGQEIKALLEVEAGPEEGADPSHIQNWDWNDDRCRRVSILRRAFRPDLISKLQTLLTGEFADFQIILSLRDDWKEGEAWGCMKIGTSQVAIQRNVAQAYSIAA